MAAVMDVFMEVLLLTASRDAQEVRQCVAPLAVVRTRLCTISMVNISAKTALPNSELVSVVKNKQKLWPLLPTLFLGFLIFAFKNCNG